MYLLKLALRPWRLAPLSQFFSAVAVGFLLLLVGFLHWMQTGLSPVVARLKSEQVVTAYLDPSVPQKDETKVVDAIRLALGAQAAASDIRLVDAPEFVSELKGQYPELARDLEELGPELKAIVPRYVSISGMLNEDASEQIGAVTGIENAESSKDRYQHIVGAFSALRWVARLLMVGLCMALLTGLIHLSRMNSYLHRDALGLLRFWGAGGAVLRTPGMLSGLSVGVLGGVIALAGWVSGGNWLAGHVRNLSPMLKQMQLAGFQLGLVLFVLGTMIGWLAGLLGTLSSDVRGGAGRG